MKTDDECAIHSDVMMFDDEEVLAGHKAFLMSHVSFVE
jgi:hypothetical protein